MLGEVAMPASEANICNTDRAANIVTMYLAKYLNINVNKIIGSPYDPTSDKIYPYYQSK